MIPTFCCLDLAYPRDKRFAANAAFLSRVVKDDAALTIYNLMELLGQLSFNLAPARLDAWQAWLIDAYQLTVIWPIDPSDPAANAFFVSRYLNGLTPRCAPSEWLLWTR